MTDDDLDHIEETARDHDRTFPEWALLLVREVRRLREENQQLRESLRGVVDGAKSPAELGQWAEGLFRRELP